MGSNCLKFGTGCYVWIRVVLIFTLSLCHCSVAAKVPSVDIVKASATSPSKIVLSWKPAYQLKRGNLKFMIRYKEENARFQRLVSPKPHQVLRNLQPNTVYTIAVRAVRGKENGDWSRSINVKTFPKNSAKTNTGTGGIHGNVTVEEITTDSAFVTWSLNVDPDQINGFKAFRVVWKNKKKKKEEEMRIQNFTLDKLEADTRYIVNVYLFTNDGVKTKIGNAKFITKEDQLITPKNFRVTSLTDTTVEVKWRRFDRTNPDSPVTGYVLEYKLRETEYTAPCTAEVNKTEKSYSFEGLIPDTKYGLRLAGKFDHVIGPFSDWLKIKTEPYNANNSNIRIYHISFSEILTIWRPTEGYPYRSVSIYDTKDTTHQTVHRNFAPTHATESVVFWNELEPDTDYQLMIRETTKPFVLEQALCPRTQIAYFTTNNATCHTGCHDDEKLFSADVKGGFYDPYLRLLPLPGNGSNVVTWSAYTDYVSNTSYFYVLKVLGQPFLSLLHSYFIPIGQTHHVIEDLDPDKPYSINLVVFDESSEKPIFTSEYLLVIPTKDIPLEDYDQNETMVDMGESISSMDMYWKSDRMPDREVGTIDVNEDIVFQQLDDLNITLASKMFPEDTFDTVDFPALENQTTDTVHKFLQQVKPEVVPIEDITVKEGSMADITCLSRGDPYPIITWINLTTNESIINVNSRERIYTTLSKYVGSVMPVNSRTFLGVKSFLTIKNISLSDDGQYACAAENSAGLDIRAFNINVLPKPPGPILNLISSAPTPFEIHVSWEPPVQSGDHHVISPVIGYRLALLDEYDVMMGENNATGTSSVFSHLLPNTLYKILVSAYHRYGEGEQRMTEAKTRRIPILGPAQNVTVVTLNSTIIQVNWEHPLAVSSNQIHLRKYILHLRKEGDRKSGEHHIERNVTEVVFRDLMPEQLYGFRIIGMSEDGQVSYSEWTRGSTYREAYMNESLPPPPPYNVYLRLESGNIIVSWLAPRNDDNIIVRGYAITVLNNGTKREAMEVGYEESSVLVYEVDMGIIYQISVQAKNKAGLSVEQWAELYIPEISVTDKPVDNFRGRGVSSTSVQLQWDPPGEGAYSHLKVTFTPTEGGSEGSSPGTVNLPRHPTNYIVGSLEPFSEYLFTITPYFKHMEGVSSNTTVQTLSDRPSFAPEHVTLDSYNSTAILIRCQPPSRGKNGVILTYKVSYRTKRTWRNDVVFPAEDDETLNSYVIGLLPSTLYEFRVRALTVNGSGPWSQWQHIRTRSPDPVVPMVPQNLTSYSTKTSITLSWRPPDQDINQITGYVVGYGKFIPEVYRASVARETNIYTIEKLEPGSMYIISVRSFNEYGESVAAFDVISTLV